MQHTDWSGARERVESLSRHPHRDAIFGAEDHQMRLEPPLSADELDDLERHLGVSLPEDYRTFLTQVSAGGAGPAYGVFPVRRDDSGSWRWHGDGADMTRHDLVKVPFQVDRPYGEILDRLADECPDEEAFDEIENFDTAMEQWQERLYAVLAEPGMDSGAICLVHYGCAQRAWLVVTGPARGQMWWDHRCDEHDLAPMLGDGDEPVGFGAWYLNWLASAEERAAGRAMLTPRDGDGR
ncbi:SMI1/KNR4 family protein [Catellatospora sichuanensis]|uniref:SMI1/KNR4 family protein n=1 Tax=Catellatospora sichuanensis TaxID=1969805 RepID=UPI0011835F50|nr:SMI1/KNR4 family protein [Catellatospora sichuanensis]